MSTDIQAAPITVPNAEETYRLMLRIREFEDAAYQLFLQNLIHGTMHLGTGQEAIAAGVEAALRPDDYVLSTYRGHAHVIARGAALDAAMAEMFGRVTGLCKGKGGSMHLTSVPHGALGSYAIVGAHLPIGCGTGWSAKLRGTDQVTVCFFGDGATNIGYFHEALNLAAVWKLPVIFVCENNLYMEFTPIHHVTAVKHPAADRASAYGLEPILIDGNDVEAVYQTAHAAAGRARSGAGPTLIEAETYRHRGHSRTDPARYRSQEELAAWLERDPIPAFRRRMEETGSDPARLDAMEAEVRDEVEQAVERAKAAPVPPLAEIETDIYAEDSTTWRN
ncbi:MAG TPA: thiamine pyrophosphate-dependent dehydrogenase E1 component subunit alpha [Chloroflexota bacterium]|nr:thiamine pyrophosphate-dependent dehydrogenase E1 component subunit alpha [Chloroflexota bacterium]